MKKTYIYIMIILFIFLIVGCGKEEDKNDKEEMLVVTQHIDDNLFPVEVKKGSKIDFEYEDEDYIFAGWYDETLTNKLDGTIINENMDIYAYLIEKGKSFKINYVDNGGKFLNGRIQTYKCGKVTEVIPPVRENNYEFDGWLLNGEKFERITEDMYGEITLEPVWIDLAKHYTITYDFGDGTKDGEPIVNYRMGDADFVLPNAIPSKDGDYFWGWYLDKELTQKVTNITEDMEENLKLYAGYGMRKANNIKISFIGDSITTYSGYIPSGYATYYPNQTCKVSSVEQTWWYSLTDKLGFSLLMNNSYSGSKVIGGAEPCESEARLANISKDGVNPDIVVIYMGTNDWASPTPTADFYAGYEKMIKYIFNTCGDDVHIYCCVIPYCNYGAGFNSLREGINNEIIKLINKYNLYTIDFREVIKAENYSQLIFDGSDTYNCHPNATGHAAMADYAYDIIYKNEKGTYIEND